MQYMIRGFATWQTPVLHGAVRRPGEEEAHQPV